MHTIYTSCANEMTNLLRLQSQKLEIRHRDVSVFLLIELCLSNYCTGTRTCKKTQWIAPFPTLNVRALPLDYDTHWHTRNVVHEVHATYNLFWYCWGAIVLNAATGKMFVVRRRGLEKCAPLFPSNEHDIPARGDSGCCQHGCIPSSSLWWTRHLLTHSR